MSRLILWVAQGFGIGRIPVAPGTFGSVVGMLWFLLLLKSGSPLIYAFGTIAGVVLSIWLCGEAEKKLNRRDPPSVVLDEICAVPVCFAAWVAFWFVRHGRLPAPEVVFSHPVWPLAAAVFVAFRLFDIFKPWPIRQSQNLSGGLGVTMDDLIAAAYVNLLTLLTY